jgi:hypothetical protein
MDDITMDDGSVRKFETGATRSSAEGRYDPEGYLSPLALERWAEYMHKHQYQADGSMRESDNWQKGMPQESMAKGMWRHFLHFWLRHRGFTPNDVKSGADIEEDLCAIIFNAQAYLHNLLVAKCKATRAAEAAIDVARNSVMVARDQAILRDELLEELKRSR